MGDLYTSQWWVLLLPKNALRNVPLGLSFSVEHKYPLSERKTTTFDSGLRFSRHKSNVPRVQHLLRITSR